MKNINNVGEQCCGCGACIGVCSQNAIVSVRGSRGELFYKANDACVNCGRCTQVCSALNFRFHEKLNYFYKAKTKNADTLKKSSSGGIAYEAAKHAINKGYSVYGAAWNILNQQVEHKKFDSCGTLYEIQGSKYVHSSISKEIYSDIIQTIKTKKVLFIGCPCQVSAVKNIVNNNDNLLCVDLVCHGVPSPELLNNQIKKITNKKVDIISFRRGTSFVLDLADENGKEISVNGYDNPYYVLFLTYTSLRESCYKCQYAQRQRVGDLTIGDYVEDGEGFSCVLANSEKGQKLINETRTIISYEERNADLLISNDALNHPTVRNNKVDRFTDRYNKYGLYYAYYRTFSTFVLKRIVRKVLGDQLYDKLVKHC